MQTWVDSKTNSNQDKSLIISDYSYMMSTRVTNIYFILQVCFDNDAVLPIMPSYGDKYRPIDATISKKS